MPRLKASLLLLSLATASGAPVFAQTPDGAVPGTINFTAGQTNIDGHQITNTPGANRPTQLKTGQTLATARGSADILLAPGALLRVGDDSTVQMVAADTGRTEVRLAQGLANVSVNVVRNDHLLLVDLPNGQTQMLSRGLYTFNTATGTLRVFSGEADVFPGTDLNANVKPIAVKEGHEVAITGERVKPASFDSETADADLLPWTGPAESQAALADGTVTRHLGSAYSNAGYYPGAYGFYGGGYGYGDPFFYAGDPYGGWGYPYGPYGLGGYPFFGVGFGLYGGGYGYGGYGYRGSFLGPYRNGTYGGGLRSGYAGRGFTGGGFGGARGFSGGGGGFRGGGGGGRR